MVGSRNSYSNYKGGKKKLMGQIKLTISLVLIGLFSIAIITFAMNFANDNDAAINLANDPELLSLSVDTDSSVSGFVEDSESQ